MRHVIAALLSLAAFAVYGLASNPSSPARAGAPVTVLLQFEQEHSDLSVQEMKKELAAIMVEAGLKFDFRLLRDVTTGDSFNDLVVIRFRGTCRMDIQPVLLDERGPLAFTHSSDGHILPFTEVECDRIRLSVRSAMLGIDRPRADLLLGRALGRVVAHEIFHIVGGTRKHGQEGVAKTALSGRQLIAEKLALHPDDVDRLHTH